VTDGVYMLEHSQGSGNSTVVITNDGVVVFDFHIDNADQTLAFIRKTTDKKVRYLITSHSAGDHATGSWHFRDDKPTWIATRNQIHDLQMQELKEFNERKQSNDPRYAAYKKADLGQPDIGFDGSMTLYLGGLAFVITAEGRGHSTGDLTVYIPQKRVFLMGDLLDTKSTQARESRRKFFTQTCKGGSTSLITSCGATSPSKLTFPVMVPSISAGASKIWRNKSATSWSCAMKWPRWSRPENRWSKSKRNLKCRRSSRIISGRNA
jgi:Metallo-beta-lactamase superfamily